MCATKLANAGLVSQSNEHDSAGNYSVESKQNATPFAQPTTCATPAPQETDPPRLPLIRNHLNNKEISATAKEIIMASCRASTSKQYQLYLSRWEVFCKSRNINKFTASTENGIDFLASLYEKGLGYSAINTARCALSSVLDKHAHASHVTPSFLTDDEEEFQSNIDLR